MAQAHSVENAARHVVVQIPEARPDETVGQVLARIPTLTFESLEAVYVVDDEHRLLGAVRLVDLFGVEPKRPLAEFVDRNYPRVGPHHDQEHVAAEALAAGCASVAVVDDTGILVGEVPAVSLLEILRQEHVEDLHRLAGIRRENTRTRRALEAPPLRRARHRLPWLLVGLVGSMLAAGVMSRFERILASNLAIAFFVPTIVYLADAIGTQTEAIAVRGLSLSRQPIRHLLAGELRTGLLIGVTLAALAFPIVAYAFGDSRLAVCVSAAIVVAGGVATSIGLLLPWLLQRMGSDPALGSGPVATIVQDVLSLVIYFAIATLLMGLT
jgi:magnesium transporter